MPAHGEPTPFIIAQPKGSPTQPPPQDSVFLDQISEGSLLPSPRRTLRFPWINVPSLNALEELFETTKILANRLGRFTSEGHRHDRAHSAGRWRVLKVNEDLSTFVPNATAHRPVRWRNRDSS